MGQTSITPDMAFRLPNAFKRTPHDWMNMHTSYDVARAAKKATHKGYAYGLARRSSNWSMESLPVTSSENPTKEKP